MLRSIVLVMLLVPSTALASSVIALSEAELVAASDTIVVGTVVQVAPAISNNSVRTQVLIQVQLGVRGAREGDVVTVDIPGGDLHGIRHQVAGAPSFKAGQLVLAFLKTYGTLRRPLGLSYGIYALSLKNGTWMANRDLSGLALLAKGGQHLPPTMVSSGEEFGVLLPRVQEHVRALREGVK